MNIFWLDFNPTVCASYMVDKHVVKMILEYAQLLGSAHTVCDGKRPDGVPRLKNINHPCARWVRESRSNYRYLYLLFVATLNEKAYRYGSAHSYEHLAKVLSVPPKNIKQGTLTNPMLALGTGTSRRSSSVQQAIAEYRNYYATVKVDLFRWTRRPIPAWLTHGTVVASHVQAPLPTMVPSRVHPERYKKFKRWGTK